MIAVASAFSNNDDDDIAEALMAIEHDDLLLSSAMAESDGADRRGLLPERSPNKLRDFACGERGILLVSMADRSYITRRCLSVASLFLALCLIVFTEMYCPCSALISE